MRRVVFSFFLLLSLSVRAQGPEYARWADSIAAHRSKICYLDFVPGLYRSETGSDSVNATHKYKDRKGRELVEVVFTFTGSNRQRSIIYTFHHRKLIRVAETRLDPMTGPTLSPPTVKFYYFKDGVFVGSTQSDNSAAPGYLAMGEQLLRYIPQELHKVRCDGTRKLSRADKRRIKKAKVTVIYNPSY